MKRILKSLAWNLGLPLGLFCGMYFFYPFRQSFEMDFDEGVNLIKALLLLRGFPLYRLVWSDQPPLFTYLLAGEFRLAGLSVNAARLLVLLFSCALLWGITHYLRLVWGDLHALAGAFLLLLLPGYLSLSVSAMIGLPALTWAMLALVALAYWHRRHAYPWLVASALALSLAALTKLFAGVLAPVFAVGIFAGEVARLRGDGRWLPALLKALLPAAAWSALFALVVAGVLLVTVGPANLSQLIAPHLTAFENRLFQEVGAYTLQRPARRRLVGFGTGDIGSRLRPARTQVAGSVPGSLDGERLPAAVAGIAGVGAPDPAGDAPGGHPGGRRGRRGAGRACVGV